MLALFLLAAAPKHHAEPPPVIQTVTAPPPLVQVNTPSPLQFGAWSAQSYRTWVESWTTNSAGSVFGIACGKSCIAYVNNGKSCDKDQIVPALVSLPAGATNVSFKCYVINNRHFIGFALDGDWIENLGKGGTIGIALAMQNGTFAVSRFSLDGAVGAMNKMGEWMKAKEDNGTRPDDFTI